jgi:RNA polymerase sigma-70 factor, ECF subfamily
VEQTDDSQAPRWPNSHPPRQHCYTTLPDTTRRVALNLATSGLRRTRRQLAALARLRPPTTEPAHPTDRVAIQAGLQLLPLHYRQVLVLHYGADLSVEQVAHQLRLPTGTVKSRLARARAALGAYLEQGQEERGHARG